MTNIPDFNKTPVQDLGDQVMDLGGAGTGFDFFKEHMGVVGVNITNAPNMPLSNDMSGPAAGLSGLVLGNNKAKPSTPTKG